MFFLFDHDKFIDFSHTLEKKLDGGAYKTKFIIIYTGG